MVYLSYFLQLLTAKYGVFVVSLGNLLVLLCLLRPRFRWWGMVIAAGLMYLSLPLLYVLFISFFGTGSTGTILLTLLGYFADLVLLISFRGSFWKKVTLLFILHVLNRLFTFWAYILHPPLQSLFGRGWDVQASVTLVVGSLFAVIILVCWFPLKERLRSILDMEIQRHSWMIMAAIAIAAKLIIDFSSDYVFALNPLSERKIIWAMVALSFFVLSVLVLYLYNIITTIRQEKLQASTDRLVFEMEAQRQFYETQFHNQEQLQRMKHDMDGHLNTISRLLSHGDGERALEYLTQLQDYAKSSQKRLYSQDPYLNAVVANFAELYQEKGISFEAEIQVGTIQEHHVELCLILNNALQNALDASLRLLPEDRYVKLQVKVKQGRLLLRITNRFNRLLVEEGDRLLSTKAEGRHGYGLASIRSAAESLGGFAEYRVEGDLFVLEIAM